ncbi:MAG: FmdB family zinc ribbon protein [Bacteroidota bacterium]
MPTYTYHCKNCEYEFDHLQKISDDLLKKCPSCGKETLIRLIGGGAGLVFKGSGFYNTDYKKSSSSESSSSTSKPVKKESKDTPQPEAKPEPKTPSKKDSTSGKSSDSK